MAMLTGLEILRQVELGNIVISDFDKKRLNPNSYNLRLGDTLLEYIPNDDWPVEQISPGVHKIKRVVHLSTRDKNKPEVIEHKIPPEGFTLEPGKFYLGTTMEYTESGLYVPGIDGRSSTGRLSLDVHATAGFGDVGFKGHWTLELSTLIYLDVFVGDEIAQIHYETIEGDPGYKYNGRYQGQDRPVQSLIGQDKKGAFPG